MIDRDKAYVMMGRNGRHIAVVVGPERGAVVAVLDRLIAKLSVL